MIEEHVSFHFQQLSSWIDRVLMCYFTFLKVEKAGIFFWKPEIRPTLTAQKKYSKVCLGFNFFSHDEAACQVSFQSLLSTIIYLFDILVDFPGGRKIRKILPGFSRSRRKWDTATEILKGAHHLPRPCWQWLQLQPSCGSPQWKTVV